MRVIVFGVLHRPESLFVNRNAQLLLNPPGVRDPHEEAIGPTEVSSLSDGDFQLDYSRVEGRTPIEVNDQGTSTQPANPSRSPLLELANRTRSASMSYPQRSNTSTALAALFRSRSKDSIPPNLPEAEVTPTGSEGPRGRRMSFMRFLDRRAGVSAPSRLSPSSDRSRGAAAEPLSPILDHPPPFQPSSPATPSRNRIGQTTNHAQHVHYEHSPMHHPTPHPTHGSYPNYTAGGRDWRWKKGGDVVRVSHLGEQETVFIHPGDDDRVWVGPMLYVSHSVASVSLKVTEIPCSSVAAQLYPTHDPEILSQSTEPDPTDPQAFENAILYAQTTSRWASFGWADLRAVAPWLEERITKRIEGEGLGI